MQRTWIEETTKHVEETVSVNGWVHRLRKMGDKLVFVDLRDGTGLVQVVFYKPDLDEATAAEVDKLKPEFVVQIEGKVQKRGEKNVNPDLVTGTIEIGATGVTILNKAQTPPFEVEKDSAGV
ncbi:MAG: OB-fold nucleic acid binding domain-containing protein, partial [bacterium]|nr:OB-fold nucleic acid binding domain-containing protein [bacterium]